MKTAELLSKDVNGDFFYYFFFLRYKVLQSPSPSPTNGNQGGAAANPHSLSSRGSLLLVQVLSY